MTAQVLLLGAKGMLGSSFAHAVPADQIIVIDRAATDDPLGLMHHLNATSPRVIINCAADTNVDSAEHNPAPAFATNALLPGLLAQVARDQGAILIHFSSTGCYGGTGTAPHSDYAPLAPPTVHHRSKAAGEQAIRDAGCRHLILRLGWLYGGTIDHRKNFAWARILEARGKPELASDPYQTGSPTHVADVVAQTLMLLESGLTGTYNCVATGAITRYDYVARILALAGLAPRLIPKRFTRAAPVAANEAAVNDKLNQLGLNRMPNWDDALARYVQTLLDAEATRAP